MSRIILIETSTSLCSTALVEDNQVVCYKESDTPRSQAALTAPFVDGMLKERGLKVSDCDAVCVSSGPGSYTGLRVGVSTAKGLCFGAGIPLISVNTLEILVHQAIDEGLRPEGCKHIIPMIDARRMEVYTAVFKVGESPENIKMVSEIEAKVIDKDSFKDIIEEGVTLFIGDGAGKCKDVLSHPNAHFLQLCPKASAMRSPASIAFDAKHFENTAYFEPFYLKQFVATESKKKLF